MWPRSSELSGACTAIGQLLEWQTASDAGLQARTTLASTFLAMWPAPIAAAVVAGWMAMRIVSGNVQAAPASLIAVGLLLAAWFVSPAIMWYLGRPALRRSEGMDDRQQLFLRKTARRTWEYFARFVGPEHHWLPPDNFQQDPPIGEAPRTSPQTWAWPSWAIWQHGISATSPSGRSSSAPGRPSGRWKNCPGTAGTFSTGMTREHWRRPSALRVNGGQRQPFGLSGSAQAGLADLADRPILPPRWRQGLEDVIGVLLEELERPENAGTSASGRVRTTMVSSWSPCYRPEPPCPGHTGRCPRWPRRRRNWNRWWNRKANRLLVGRATPPE